MALMITEDCTSCAACEPVCPNKAISEGEVIYVIDPDKCTECVGWYDEPQCLSVCPVESISPHPEHRESRGELQAKRDRLLAVA